MQEERQEIVLNMLKEKVELLFLKLQVCLNKKLKKQLLKS